MVRNIVRDVNFLRIKSTPAGEEDRQVAKDLLDTLKANENACVGMAANMIGVNKNIIVVNIGFANMIMYNPVIIRKTGPYQVEEGCLSLIGVRATTRYQEIDVEFEDQEMKKHNQHFSGWTAQIIQHECDHLAGIII